MSDEEKPDDSEPTPERQAELRAAYEANMAAGEAPYERVKIRTRGELQWVMQERRWSGELSQPAGYERANLSRANLQGANLSGTHLLLANLSGAQLRVANLSRAFLEATNLRGANLGGANLSGASLLAANLSGADLDYANLSGAGLEATSLSGASLRAARMDATTNLMHASLDTHTRLADVVWNGVPLTRLNWQDVTVLGNEQMARQAKDMLGKVKDKETRLIEYVDAVLANRQVATVLRSQGVNEHADSYAYRAQVLQREVLRRQNKYGRWLFSAFLDALAGYGYAPQRSLLAYLLAIFGFGIAYFFVGQSVGPHLSPLGAFVFSMTSFHGRGFFPGGIALDDPITVLAAFEAFVGLVIEVSFIATFTQRFFAR